MEWAGCIADWPDLSDLGVTFDVGERSESTFGDEIIGYGIVTNR